MNADRALARLRGSPESTVGLAGILVEDALNTPIATLVEPAWLASQIAAGVEAATRTDRVRELAAQAINEALARWGESDTPLRDHLHDDVSGPLRKALSTPYVPSEALVWRVLDQPMFRSLMKEVLENNIKSFRSRLSGVDEKLLGGLGRRAAKRGRGLFGGMAESMVGAVAGEMEHQFDRRLGEFLSLATGEALRVVASHVANPDNAEAYADVRLGVVESVLDAPVRELASELQSAQPMAYVDVLLEGMRAAVASPDFVMDTERRIKRLLDEVGDGSFGAWLDEVGLREIWARSTVELLAGRLAATVQTDAFGTWWAELFEE